MKSSKAQIHARFHKIPRVRFCKERRLTSYSGLVVFQALLRAMRLRARIRACFRHLEETHIFGRASVVVLLIVHNLLGDSNGAIDFIARSLYRLGRELPDARIESRVDSAFYNERIFRVLDELAGGFTCSVPFERFPKLRAIIEVGNQLFTLAGMLAHNLGRELQMATRPADRSDLEKRPARWEFESLGTIRQHLLHNAGTLTRPRGELTLTMNANDTVRADLDRYLDGLMDRAADRAA